MYKCGVGIRYLKCGGFSLRCSGCYPDGYVACVTSSSLMWNVVLCVCVKWCISVPILG